MHTIKNVIMFQYVYSCHGTGICNFIGIYFMLLLVVCTYLPLNYIFTLLNPLVIRKIEGKIYPKISKWLSYVSYLIKMYFSLFLRLNSEIGSHF